MPVDYQFIEVREGGNVLRGYIPHDPDSLLPSGITIASGVDLGYQSAVGFHLIGVARITIRKCRSYFGLFGSSARSALRRLPLTLSPEEANDLNIRIRGRTLTRLIKAFNKDSKQTFTSLPSEFQTVLVSLATHYGSNLKRRTPNFWRQMTTGDFHAALLNLRNFGDNYSKRRNLEADLFERGLTN